MNNSPQLLVIFPGRFSPWHKGHHAVYDYLVGKFGRNNVVLATSNKVDGDKSPFSFNEKSLMMQLTGVSQDRIIEATSPYKLDDIISGGNLQLDKANTVVIFAVSKKDMDEDPRFASWTKKNGEKTYFQPLDDIKDTVGADVHAYIMTVPTYKFRLLGNRINSASEIRQMYIDADEKTRQELIKQLFGVYAQEAEQIMNDKLLPRKEQSYGRPTKLAKTAKAAGLKEGHAINAKVAGTMRQAKTKNPSLPRAEALGMYVLDTEQSDFRTVDSEEHSLENRVAHMQKQLDQLKKEALAEDREPYQSAIDQLEQRQIRQIRQLISEVKEVLQADISDEYKEILQAKLERLQHKLTEFHTIK